METTYSVIFTGQLKDDSDQEEVIRKMVEITRSTEEKIRPIFAPGKPVVIKKGLSREAAEKYVRVLTGIGMQMRVSKSQPKQPDTGAAVQPPRTAAKPPPRRSEDTPEPGPRPSGPDPNPYAAPKANLAVERKEEAAFLETPLKVSAGSGWKWIWGGLKLFFSDFWKWLAMVLVLFVIMIPVSLVPFVGNVVNPIITILFGGGLMIGAHSLYEGKGLRFGHLFSGFTQNRNQLLLLGLYYLLGMIMIMIIALLPVGTTAISLFMGLGFEDPDAVAVMMEQQMGLFFLGMGIGLLLSIPFFMSIWFASPLIAVAGMSCSAAVKLSFKGTLRNWLPFLVYGIGLLLFAIVFFLVLSSLTAATAIFMVNSQSFLLAGLVPILVFGLLAMPFSLGIGLSIYTGFRDIYYKTN